MKMDLTYTNKAGISLKDVFDIISTGRDYSKREIQDGLNTETSIDILLKKLEDASVIAKYKEGNKILYTVSSTKQNTVEQSASSNSEVTIEVQQPEVVDVIPAIEESVVEEVQQPEIVDVIPLVEEPIVVKKTTSRKRKITKVEELEVEVQQPEVVDEIQAVEEPVVIKKTTSRTRKITKVEPIIEDVIVVEEPAPVEPVVEIIEEPAPVEPVVEIIEEPTPAKKSSRSKKSIEPAPVVEPPVQQIDISIIDEFNKNKFQLLEEESLVGRRRSRAVTEVESVKSVNPVPPTSIVENTIPSKEIEDNIVVNVNRTPKLIKANVKSAIPAKVKSINEQTYNISKDHQITALIDMDEHERIQKPRVATREVSQDDLDRLKKEMEGRLGKEITTILHKRNNGVVRNRRMTAQEIYEKEQKALSKNVAEFTEDNPYRFILNFFTSSLNGEKSTPYFRRRDEYVVRSLYNKFKVLCDAIDEYDVAPQNLPFYRAITVNEEELTVKIYHIDMNRVIRGVYTIFKLSKQDIQYFRSKR